MGRLSRDRVAPEHRPRIVVGVAVESRFGVVGMVRDGGELADDILAVRRTGHILPVGKVAHDILRVEGFGHVEAVQPHLVRVDLLVPEAAVGIARLLLQLHEERIQHLPVTRLARAVVELEERTPRADVVEVVLRLAVGQHLAVRPHDRVVVAVRIADQLRSIVGRTRIADRQQFQSRGVVPLHLPGGDSVEGRRRRIAGDFALRHPQSQRFAGVVQRPARGTRGRGNGTRRRKKNQSFHTLLVSLSWFCFRLCVLRYSAGDMRYCSRKQRLK